MPNEANSLRLLEFTFQLLSGIEGVLADPSVIEQGAELRRRGLIPSFMAYMLGRSFHDSRRVGVLEEMLPGAARQFERVSSVRIPPPVALDQSVALNEDGSVTIDLSNGRVADQPNSFAVAVNPLHGTLTGSGHTRVYTPAPDYAGTDSLSFTQSDAGGQASNTATVSIAVNPINDGPIITTTGGTSGFTEGGGAVVVDAGVEVSDIDSQIGGATVTIADGHAVADDVLGFTPQAGIAGAYDAATGVLTFGGNASSADYQLVLRSVTYDNVSLNPTPSARHRVPRDRRRGGDGRSRQQTGQRDRRQ